MKWIIIKIFVILTNLYSIIFINAQTLSQNSNYFITKSSTNKIFISSLDGLNIYDGLKVKQYKASNSNMYGNNIQSCFFEDKHGIVWFTTYEALHYYDPTRNKVDHLFIKNEKDTIKNDYKIVSQIGDTLVVAAGKKVFLYNTKEKKKVKSIEIDFMESVYQLLILYNDKYYAIATKNSTLEINELSKDFLALNKKTIPIDAFSLSLFEKSKVLIGTFSGKAIIYDFIKHEIEFESQIFTTLLQGIQRLNANVFLLSSTTEDIFLFDIKQKRVIDKWNINDKQNGQKLSSFTLPYLDKDSIFWIGVDGKGIVNKDLRKEKFKHILNYGNNGKSNKVTGIAKNTKENKFAFTTRGNGIFILNNLHEIIDHFKIPFSFNPYWYSNTELLYTKEDQILLLDLISGKSKLIAKASSKDFIISFERIDNENYLFTSRTNKVHSLDVERKTINTAIANTKIDPFIGLKFDGSNHIFISMNEQSIWVYKKVKNTYKKVKELDIPSGVLSLGDIRSITNKWYITNNNGVYSVDKSNFTFNKIKDKQNLLGQTVYSCIEDNFGKWWISTNSGIMRYDKGLNDIYKYKLSDGMQALEFNTNAYLHSAEGNIYFGGVNGVNFFNPSSINPSFTKATVCIDNILVNDQSTTLFGEPDFVKNIKIKFGSPLSLFFHAIDYGDIESARLKYKLIGSDQDYVFVDEFKGNVRYPNLPPGHYTLQILAANSDGIWNKEPKTIKIEIIPPFWMTWWFYCLSAIALFSITYYTIKSHYTRKLEKQNQLLREQSLIIQSQQAIEAERNRIASEMHDYLSSGLTTIRYLSDHAMTKLQSKEELKDLEKIATQSNSLIRNMSEIIWAMNSRFDNAEQLFAYIKRYANDYLDMHNLPLKFVIEHDEDINLSGEKRRNIFLVVKEILHNAVKYSKAESIEIKCSSLQEQLSIKINEIKGIGFDPSISENKGNGIYNMRERMKKIGGSISFEKEESWFTTFVKI